MSEKQSMHEKQRAELVEILKALSDARFKVEMFSIQYGDTTALLSGIRDHITGMMRSIGNEYL